MIVEVVQASAGGDSLIMLSVYNFPLAATYALIYVMLRSFKLLVPAGQQVKVL